ncbi:MAG: type II toxin-antitoxin system HigB family toxin [Pyrinomonadaceae bacterium]
MHVISYKAIRDFVRKNPGARSSLDSWYRTAKSAKWQSLAEVRKQYSHADIVGKYTVFNVKKNDYRLITRIRYRSQTIFIISILSHREYDKGKWNK